MTSVRTNLGPFTTPFTYPASCSVVVQDCSTCNLGWQGQSCGNNQFNTQGVQDNLDCWPPRDAENLSTGVAVMGWGFYSPGLDCPIGYATACASTAGTDGGFPFQFSMLPHETAVGCCPTGYSCSYNPGIDAAQTCYKYYSTGSFPTVQCSKGTSNKFSYVTVPATVTATVSPTTTGGSPSITVAVLQNVLVFAPLIQINWQATDLLSTTPLPGGATTTTSQTSPPTSTAATPKSDGLSQGAVIGIAVAAAIVGLILIAIFAIWMRRRQQRPKVMPTLPPNPYMDKPHEIGTTYVAEAPTERDAHEIDGLHKGGSISPRYEMAG
ncbi:hypothetical protein BR93DRAFT_973053 [Coniochaeta sp. PMI_546]|nr:hypothetical protein BR93DRAFT_973053 [Coniochaeta sp. PMI_546]